MERHWTGSWSELKKIERENRDLEGCLTEVLTLWLKGNYNSERFGEPSWELLARAVADPAGGNNPALAEEITRQYGGVNIWCWSCWFRYKFIDWLNFGLASHFVMYAM